MLRRIFTTATAAVAFFLAAGDAPEIIVPPEESAPRTAETGRLLRLRSANADNTADTPRGSLAARIAEPNTTFVWTPSPDPARITGGAALADAALSPDESTLILVERVGGTGPNSTRLICVNLHNGKTVRVIELKDRKLAAAAFQPARDEMLWAVENAQPELDRPARLIGIDLLFGEVKYESAALELDPAGFAVGKGRLWVTLPKKTELFEFADDAPGVPPQVVRSKIEGAYLRIAPDTQTLLLLGPGRLERFRIASGEPEYLGSAPLPCTEPPTLVIPVSEDGSEFAFASQGGSAYLAAGGATRQIDDNCGQTGCFRAKEGFLLLAVEPQEAIQLYLPNATTPSVSVSPGKLRPFNKNSNFRLFALSSEKPELILVDHRADIARIEIRPRRWIKSVIFTPDVGK